MNSQLTRTRVSTDPVTAPQETIAAFALSMACDNGSGVFRIYDKSGGEASEEVLNKVSMPFHHTGCDVRGGLKNE